MTREWRLWVLPLLGGLLFIVLLANHLSAGAGRVQACSCAGSSPPRESFIRADAVFSGTLISAERWGVAEFEVHTLWKGPLTTRIRVRYWTNCSYDFMPGDEGTGYLVYAYRAIEPSEVTAGICGRTQRLEHAEEDLEVLGEGLSLAGGGASIALAFAQGEPVQFREGRIPWVIAPGAARQPPPSAWTLVILIGIAGALVGLGRLASRGASSHGRRRGATAQ